MIASTPIARWTWGHEGESEDWIEKSLSGVLSAFSVLARYGLAVGRPRVHVSIPEAGNPKNYLFRGDLEVDDAVGTRLIAQVKGARRPGELGAVEADISCPGVWLSEDGAEHREERMFTLGTSVMLGYFTVYLATFSDAWLPYDLRGRKQEAVHAANYPRLAAALRDMSELIGDDTEPDDPSWFGKPTETGVDNYFEDDGSASDVWGSFEIPYRNRVFYHGSGLGGDGYAKTANGQVEYVAVAGEHGVLGYLWAADAEGAASYEPRDAAEDAGYQAGLRWLERLREAKEHGLSPSAALVELSRDPGDHRMGRVVPGSRTTAPDLATVRELAEREG